jgi:hypothetical protein
MKSDTAASWTYNKEMEGLAIFKGGEEQEYKPSSA